MVELLEILKGFKQNGKPVPIDQIVAKMDRSREEVQRLAQAAVNRGFAYQTEAASNGRRQVKPASRSIERSMYIRCMFTEDR